MRDRLVWLFTGFRYESAAPYQEAMQWVTSFDPKDRFTDRGAFALDYARTRYAESTRLVDVVLARGIDLLKTAGMLATIVATVTTALGVACGPFVALSLVSFLLAMVALVWTSRAVTVPIPPSVRGVVDGLASWESVPYPDAWLAASYHAAVVGTDLVNRWRSAWLTIASGLICLGVLFLLPVALWAGCRLSS